MNTVWAPRHRQSSREGPSCGQRKSRAPLLLPEGHQRQPFPCVKKTHTARKEHPHTLGLTIIPQTSSPQETRLSARFTTAKINKTTQPPTEIWKSPPTMVTLTGTELGWEESHRSHSRWNGHRGLRCTSCSGLLLGSVNTTLQQREQNHLLAPRESLPSREVHEPRRFCLALFSYSHSKIIFSQIGSNSCHVGSFQTPPHPCLRPWTTGLSPSCPASAPSSHPSFISSSWPSSQLSSNPTSQQASPGPSPWFTELPQRSCVLRHVCHLTGTQAGAPISIFLTVPQHTVLVQ